MLTNVNNTRVFLCLLFCIADITAAAGVANNWSYRRSKVVGFRPAYTNNQTQWQRSNQTNVPSYNNINQPSYRPVVSKPQPPRFVPVAVNPTRSSWQQPQVSNHYHKQQGNQTFIPWQQQPQAAYHVPSPGYGSNQTRATIGNYPYPSQGNFNQTRPPWPQPLAPNAAGYPQYPANRQSTTFNQTLPVWPQPSAPQLPNAPAQPQTNLYPKLPNTNLPQAQSFSGGQAILSYGPGQYPLPVANHNKNVPTYPGSSNPYAKMFN